MGSQSLAAVLYYYDPAVDGRSPAAGTCATACCLASPAAIDPNLKIENPSGVLIGADQARLISR
jgi:hypothetical protein